MVNNSWKDVFGGWGATSSASATNAAARPDLTAHGAVVVQPFQVSTPGEKSAWWVVSRVGSGYQIQRQTPGRLEIISVIDGSLSDLEAAVAQRMSYMRNNWAPGDARIGAVVPDAVVLEINTQLTQMHSGGFGSSG
jgi:hypothetical protein